jgi:hypothetical protein
VANFATDPTGHEGVPCAVRMFAVPSDQIAAAHEDLPVHGGRAVELVQGPFHSSVAVRRAGIDVSWGRPLSQPPRQQPVRTACNTAANERTVAGVGAVPTPVR